MFFGWKQSFPGQVGRLSSFTYKLAKAFLQRELIFKEMIVEERIQEVASTRISPHSLIVRFLVITFQQISDTNEGINIIGGVYVTVLCNHEPAKQQVNVSVLHSEFICKLKQKVAERESPDISKIRYRYKVFSVPHSNRFLVRIVGALYVGGVFSSSTGMWQYERIPFVNKQALLLVDHENRVTKRLS